MKKIFLLLTLTAVLVCLFAISASAATPNTEGESVTLDDGTVCPIWDTDGDALIWYKSTANTEDGYAAYDYVKAQDERVDYYANGQYSADGQLYNQVSSIKIDNTDAKSIIVVLNINDPEVKVTSAKDAATEKKCLGGPVNGFESTFKQSSSIEYAYLRTDFIAFQASSFNQCTVLKYVNFEKLGELRSIASTAFNKSPKLFANTTLDLSQTKVVSIGTNALAELYMTELKLPDTLKTVDSYAFQYSYKLTRLDLPDSITSFSNNASFRECNSLETITGFGRLLENNIVKSFGAYMFNNCYKLKNVDGLITDGVLIIPEGITAVGSNNGAFTFQNCDELVYVEFPSTINYLCQGAFASCNKLQLVSFEKVSAKISNAMKNGEKYTPVTFNNCGTFKECPSLVAISLPEGTTKIINRLLQKCDNLTAVYMPDSVTQIGTNAKAESNKAGQGAFCSSPNMYFVQESFTVSQCLVDGKVDLTKLNLPEKPTVYFMPASFTSFIGHVESNSSSNSREGSVFSRCTSINDVIVFPAGYTSFNAAGAFYEMGSAQSPKTIVFLGNMTGYVTTKNAKYVSFVFASNEDESPADIGITHVYQNTNNTGSYMYFCATGKKYDYHTSSKEIKEADAIAAYVAGLVEIKEAYHINNPKAEGDRVVSGATCTDNEKVVDICFCGKKFNEHYVEGTALGHDEVISIAYKNGFTVNGVKHVCCVRDNCEYEKDEAVSAIFTGFLYATREEDDGICGLVFTYEINNEALALYESINNTQVVFGALSVAEHNLGSNSPIGTDGKANQDKVVRAQLSGTGINHVDYIIRGSADAWNAVFNADTGATVKDVKFYILGYVIENGSVNYFLGENTNGDITKLSATTYNLATNA